MSSLTSVRLDRPVRDIRSHGSRIALDGEFEDSDSAPRWVQVALEGEYLGYRMGTAPFAFTRQTFEEAVANIRRHPSYKANAEGVGIADVIPWDFDHASEHDPSSGAQPMLGAPAQGWTLDMKVRTGDSGLAELWALTRFVEPARTYVRSGQYQWASVALTFDAIDAVSGENMGAVITSIALTNKPFIEGMQKLVASNGGKVKSDVELRHYAADTPDEAIGMLKSMFGLGEAAELSELQSELAKVKAWIADNVEPPGVDVDDIAGAVRKILNLPLTASDEVAIDQAMNMITGLQPQAAKENGAATAAKESAMDFLKLLASKLGVREAEDAVADAVVELIELRGDLKAALSLDRDTRGVILDAVRSAVGDSVHLGSLVTALEVQDAKSAVSKVTDLVTANAEYEKVKPEIEELRASKKEREEAEIKSDVDAALASKGFGDEMRSILTLARTNDPEDFAKKFPKTAPVASSATSVENLTSSVAATPQGTQLSVDHQGRISAGASPQSSGQSVKLSGKLGADTVDLSMYPGNVTQKMLAHLSATRSGFKELSWEDQCEQASIALEKFRASQAA